MSEGTLALVVVFLAFLALGICLALALGPMLAHILEVMPR